MTRRARSRANGEGTLFRIDTPHGVRWRAEATIGWDARGKRVSATGTGATQAIARERLERNRTKKLVLLGELPPTAIKKDNIKVRTQTLGAYLEGWLAGLNPQRISDETRRGYAGRIANHVIPELGDVPLTLLSREHIQQFFYQHLPHKRVSQTDPTKRLSPGAIRNVWKPLFKALSQAEAEGLIQVNPMASVERPREEAPEVDLDTSLPGKLLAALSGQKDQTMWLFAFVLGVRQSELLGLTWDRVHLDAAVPYVEIRQQLARGLGTHGCAPAGQRPTCGARSAAGCPQKLPGRGLYIKPITKTKAGKRSLPLTRDLHIALVEQKERFEIASRSGCMQWIDHPGLVVLETDDDLSQFFTEEFGESLIDQVERLGREAVVKMWVQQAADARTDEEDALAIKVPWTPVSGLENLVFTNDNGTPITHKQYTDRWTALCERAGIEHQRGHLNRHITATLLADAGVSPAVAQRVLGHSSERMTEYYTHLNSVRVAREPLEELNKTLVKAIVNDLDRVATSPLPDDGDE